jgi:hypothetical protein
MFKSIRVKAAASKEIPVLPYREFLETYCPEMVRFEFGPHHLRLWNWVSGLNRESATPTRVEVWPRGGAKSTSSELAVCWLSTTLQKKFVLYVCSTQAKAEEHVQSIATLMERIGIERSVGIYGQSKGWKKNLLRTANGFNVAAAGLDTAIRGIKLDDLRPDLIIFDDFDDDADTEYITEQKERRITNAIIPSGDPICADYLFLQNLIIPTGIMTRLVEGLSYFATDRDIPEIIPAYRDLEVAAVTQESGVVKYVITGGTPTWEGQGKEVCEMQIAKRGLRAFLRESQHNVLDSHGQALWSQEIFDRPAFRVDPCIYWKGEVKASGYNQGFWEFIPPEPMVKMVVGLDPSVADPTTARGIPDECGIIAAGIGRSGRYYVLADASGLYAPEVWAKKAVELAMLLNCPIVFEANQGGKLIDLALQTHGSVPTMSVHAADGKRTRAEPVSMMYWQGMVSHSGELPQLERSMLRWNPYDSRQKSPNRIDALVWAIFGLGLSAFGEMRSTSRLNTRQKAFDMNNSANSDYNEMQK